MDFTSKYRTRYPPKEHEEAVRMLLEGISKPSAQEPLERANNNRLISNRKVNNVTKENVHDYDRKSLTSILSSSSSESAIVDIVNESPIMRSKATSTGDSVSTGSDAEARYKEPIPSRTIAVQCDLKSSTMKRDRLFDASMQASSISSTRYGFYNYSPETLETRRKLQRSVSSREMGPLTRAKSPLLGRGQIEAPTSMSELSSSLSASDEEAANISIRKSDQDRKFSSSYNSSSESTSKVSINRRTNMALNQEPIERVARARINSLPRRPMTALSYVSTSKLREPRSTSRSGEESDFAQPMKNRAMSQQVLSQIPPEQVNDFCSESEPDDVIDNQYNSFQENRAEEMVILKRSQPQANKPKSRLIASIHNEEVRDFNTLNAPATQTLLRERNQARAMNNEFVSNKSDWQEANNNIGHRSESRKTLQTDRAISRDEDFINCINNNNNNNQRKPPIPPKPEHSITEHYRPEQENQINQYYVERDNNINRLNSMSLSRKPRDTNLHERHQPGYYTSSRLPKALSKNNRSSSNVLLSKPTTTPYLVSKRYTPQNTASEVNRSTSMRQVERPIPHNNPYIYDGPPREGVERKYSTGANNFEQVNNFNYTPEPTQRVFRGLQRNESEDSESPSTRTWANPNEKQDYDTERGRVLRDRKNARSYSMRDVNNIGIARVTRYQEGYNEPKSEFASYNSGSESSALESVPRFVKSHPLDYDSQHRLNESGLPEVNVGLDEKDRSYLQRIATGRAAEGELISQYPASRSAQIRGRAMSQQSLTRPSMPLTSARRRGGSNPGSDVGGSSMSLVSRLQGRYENAHTRSPVVMYIPQVAPKSSFLTDAALDGKVSTLRRSSRAKRKSSSQDRSRKSSMRNGSDSESSSMLRTLVRRKSRQGSHIGRRTARIQNAMYNDEEEDLDGVGQLASEVDTFKFRRRYSVPKDAKINWFAKLKQRVTSGGR